MEGTRDDHSTMEGTNLLIMQVGEPGVFCDLEIGSPFMDHMGCLCWKISGHEGDSNCLVLRTHDGRPPEEPWCWLTGLAPIRRVSIG